jgi:hypothetical protein
MQKFWHLRHYLIIDEFSMITKTFPAILSKNIGIGKEGAELERPGHSFSGIDVILCGDLHQFPPVAQSCAESLYRPVDIAHDSIECQIGCRIYEEFTTVVILKEQMRITDPIWRDFLEHLCYGHMQEKHIQMLHRLILGRAGSKSVDFQSEPWNSASLVTPRHAVRRLWNEAAAQKECRESGEHLYICTAEDHIGN